MIRLHRLWRLGAQDIRLVFYALRHPGRPLWLFPAVTALAIYTFEPFNLALPLVGFIDDFVLLPMALHWLVRLLPAEIRYDFGHRAFVR